MKKVTELGPNECIHCETQEEWDAILALSGKSRLSYYHSGVGNYYYPTDGDGTFANSSYVKAEGHTIHKAKDFLEPQFEWGEEVECSDDIVFWKKGTFVALSPKSNEYKYLIMLNNPDELAVGFKHCRKLTKKVTLNGEELTPEEAINKLKEMV